MANAVDGGAGNSQTTARTSIIKKLMPDSLADKSYWKNNQTNTWIVVHNTAGGTASSNTNYFHSGSEGKYTCTHFVIDDKEIYQLLDPQVTELAYELKKRGLDVPDGILSTKELIEALRL